ncbi:MAG: 50S ribosomal protein L18e [Candidatus Micrarchaeia archaeon]
MERAKKEKPSAGFWKEAKKLLARPVRARKGVNLSRLERLTKSGQTVLVADKILGSGKLSHPLTVAALSFSQSAKLMIEKAGGKIISVQELEKKNPEGKDLRVLV